MDKTDFNGEKIMANEKILKEADNYFTGTLHKLGTNSCGVGWNGDDAQRIRYDQLTKLIDFSNTVNICDYGCGYGYYLSYLKERGTWNGCYTGYDISKEMIQTAIQKYGENNEEHIFKVGSKIEGKYDYIVESGIFNLKFSTPDEEWKEYILDTLKEFNDHSKRGFAFNALTIYSDTDKMRDDLYYSDPLFLFDYCKRNFSRNVALLHDYELYDFTIIVRK